MEEKFQSRLRTKLREQREEIENENIEMLANIENKQKIEISKWQFKYLRTKMQR